MYYTTTRETPLCQPFASISLPCKYYLVIICIIHQIYYIIKDLATQHKETPTAYIKPISVTPAPPKHNSTIATDIVDTSTMSRTTRSSTNDLRPFPLSRQKKSPIATSHHDRGFLYNSPDSFPLSITTKTCKVCEQRKNFWLKVTPKKIVQQKRYSMYCFS